MPDPIGSSRSGSSLRTRCGATTPHLVRLLSGLTLTVDGSPRPRHPRPQPRPARPPVAPRKVRAPHRPRRGEVPRGDADLARERFPPESLSRPSDSPPANADRALAIDQFSPLDGRVSDVDGGSSHRGGRAVPAPKPCKNSCPGHSIITIIIPCAQRHRASPRPSARRHPEFKDRLRDRS